MPLPPCSDLKFLSRIGIGTFQPRNTTFMEITGDNNVVSFSAYASSGTEYVLSTSPNWQAFSGGLLIRDQVGNPRPVGKAVPELHALVAPPQPAALAWMQLASHSPHPTPPPALTSLPSAPPPPPKLRLSALPLSLSILTNWEALC